MAVVVLLLVASGSDGAASVDDGSGSSDPSVVESGLKELWLGPVPVEVLVVLARELVVPDRVVVVVGVVVLAVVVVVVVGGAVDGGVHAKTAHEREPGHCDPVQLKQLVSSPNSWYVQKGGAVAKMGG